MRRAALVVLLLVPIAARSASLPPDAPNCSLQTPPPNAGEDKPQGGLMKLYPRAKDIPVLYTGCQTVWLMHDGRWIKFSMRYYSSGTLRTFYGPQLKGEPTSVCLFQNGKLGPGSTGACPSFEEASRPAPSLAPGCVTTPTQQAAGCSKYE